METEKKVEPKKLSPRFIHFGWYGQMMCPGKKKHDGVLTVAYRQKEDNLYIGFVFCSPQDNFSRKEGREEALWCMRNTPIIVPVIPKDVSVIPKDHNRIAIEEVVNWLCGISPVSTGWIIQKLALYNVDTDRTTSRVPGWAKKWWHNIVVHGSPMGPHQTPNKTPNKKVCWHSISALPKDVFNVPFSEIVRQAGEAGFKVVISTG